VCQLLCLS